MKTQKKNEKKKRTGEEYDKGEAPFSLMWCFITAAVFFVPKLYSESGPDWHLRLDKGHV